MLSIKTYGIDGDVKLIRISRDPSMGDIFVKPHILFVSLIPINIIQLAVFSFENLGA